MKQSLFEADKHSGFENVAKNLFFFFFFVGWYFSWHLLCRLCVHVCKGSVLPAFTL